jgi:predicted transcriptional regulator
MSAVPESHALDESAMAVFTQAIESLGGARTLVEHQAVDILPGLLESAYVLVMTEEAGRSPAEIASALGISTGAVKSVLKAPMEAARPRLAEAARGEFPPHARPETEDRPGAGRLEPEFLAGALAKFAYDVVKRQQVRPSQ